MVRGERIAETEDIRLEPAHSERRTSCGYDPNPLWQFHQRSAAFLLVGTASAAPRRSRGDRNHIPARALPTLGSKDVCRQPPPRGADGVAHGRRCRESNGLSAKRQLGALERTGGFGWMPVKSVWHTCLRDRRTDMAPCVSPLVPTWGVRKRVFARLPFEAQYWTAILSADFDRGPNPSRT